MRRPEPTVVVVRVEPAPASPRDVRRELWVAAAVACIGSSNCKYETSAARFADAALAAFDERFPGAPR